MISGPLGLAFGVSAVAAFGQRVFLTMMPIATAQAGGSEALGAAILSTYLGAQAFGTLAGGWLTDRMSRARLLLYLTLLGLPAHLLAVALAPGSAGAGRGKTCRYWAGAAGGIEPALQTTSAENWPVLCRLVAIASSTRSASC